MRSTLQLDHQLRSAVNQAILGAIPDILMRVGKEGRVREVLLPRKKEGEQIEAQSWSGSTIQEKLGKDGELWQQRLERCIAEQTMIEGRWSQNEQTFEVRLSPNGPEEVLVLIRDITEQVQAQSRLARQEKLLSRLAQTLPPLMFIVELSEINISYSSRSMVQEFGHPVEASTRQWLQKHLHSEDFAGLEGLIEQAGGLLEGDVLERELRIKSPSGYFRLFRARFSVFEQDSTGRPKALCGMLEDITEARANQEALDQARLLESNGRLTATMAHEINNALTGILGLAQVLEEEMDPGQSWDDIEEIRKAAAQAMQTARRLMKSCQYPKRVPKVLDISLRLQSMLPFLGRLLPEGIESIHSNIQQNVLVQMDQGEFEQMISTLILNIRDMVSGCSRIVEFRVEQGLGKHYSERPFWIHPDQAVACITLAEQGGFNPVEHGQVGIATVQRIVRAAQGCFWTRRTSSSNICYQILLPCAITRSSAISRSAVG